MEMLHVICLDMPVPPTYGGTIDIFYKLKALHDSGVKLILHVFVYREITESTELEALAEKTYYYKRRKSLAVQFSLLPFNVRGRDSRQLIEDLCQDDYPILFEGLHSCYWLSDSGLSSRCKMVRMHNVEHEYFFRLSKSMPWGGKRLYHILESFKFLLFERKLNHANRILTLSLADREYYQTKFPGKDVRLLNCFFDETPAEVAPPQIEGKYILYHGNLALEENIRVVDFLLSDVIPHLDAGTKVVIAGRNPSHELTCRLQKYPDVHLVANPQISVMNSLVRYAHVIILVTFQPTGIKLKLLTSLAQSNAFCIANDFMLHGNELRELCVVANGAEELARAVRDCMKKPLDEKTRDMRREYIHSQKFNTIDELL